MKVINFENEYEAKSYEALVRRLAVCSVSMSRNQGRDRVSAAEFAMHSVASMLAFLDIETNVKTRELNGKVLEAVIVVQYATLEEIVERSRSSVKKG